MTKFPTLTQVYESALKLSAARTPEETFTIIVREAEKLSDALYGTIFLFFGKQLESVYSTVPLEYQVKLIKKGHAYIAFQERKAIVTTRKEFLRIHPEYKGPEMTQGLYVPLSYQSLSLGVLYLESNRREKFSQEDMKVLQLFGSLASLKLQNIKLVAKLKNSLETRDLFISMAGHELKTPLTAIFGYVQLINQSLQNNKPVKADWFDGLRSANERMSRLINELLHVNRIQTGEMKYSFSLVNPGKLIKQSVTDFSVAHRAQRIAFQDLRENQEGCISADEDKIVQVITNILNNAAKFSPDEKLIGVTLEDEGNKCKITIQDEGDGISKEDLKHLFEEFYKAKGNTREGLGLGLFISKKIIEAHKGRILIKSKVNKGTTVTLLFPSSQTD